MAEGIEGGVDQEALVVEAVAEAEVVGDYDAAKVMQTKGTM